MTRKRARSVSSHDDSRNAKRPVCEWHLQESPVTSMVRNESTDRLLRRTESLQLQTTTPLGSPLLQSPSEQQTELSMDVDEVRTSRRSELIAHSIRPLPRRRTCARPRRIFGTILARPSITRTSTCAFSTPRRRRELRWPSTTLPCRRLRNVVATVYRTLRISAIRWAFAQTVRAASTGAS